MTPFSLDAPAVRAAIMKATTDLEVATGQLSALDAAIGDGDMGLSIANGCRAIREELPPESADIAALLSEAGLIFSEKAGATIGALVGTALIRAGKSVRSKTTIGLPDLATMLLAAEQGIAERGKAQAGDKTLLDALIPARLALEMAIARGTTVDGAVEAMLTAAHGGVTNTAEMVAKFGRGRYLGERSRGHEDAGATAVYLLLASLATRAE
ncbi:dihydroxyacetone kinase family protein [Devosia naphthalenivorans]|uniref:dihydroxyacetone kinase family protein n=1 Tax=Devosia naphthalenivorans TaxID=2082392 RepID=UPI000D35A9CB|nr:DAK2 domain-containing protein [Devosia naphthalenivorans]